MSPMILSILRLNPSPLNAFALPIQPEYQPLRPHRAHPRPTLQLDVDD
jgi:hypothetical protein